MPNFVLVLFPNRSLDFHFHFLDFRKTHLMSSIEVRAVQRVVSPAFSSLRFDSLLGLHRVEEFVEKFDLTFFLYRKISPAYFSR